MQIAHLLHRLPPPVLERVRVLRDRTPGSGEFVLYWLHHAMRGHENPALYAAISAGEELGLPVLVYQGIAERYAYASDRHHTFILQGVRDMQAELAERGVRFVCHVERPGHRGPHLITLARRAALMVTEDIPVQPTWGWLHGLIETTECPVWCVDTACVVPMQLVGQAYDRAFRFRQATAKLYQERLPRAWEELPSTQRGYEPERLPFQPVDVRSIDLPDLISQCEIDHMVGPVPHTVGGSVAGYQRWECFRRAGLSSYARRRNDPLVDGVSRMFAYLHYGMVSPLRIAREAAEQNADKFLDELLIWRELAHNPCFHSHSHDHERLSVLPGWARDTLVDREKQRQAGPRHRPRNLDSACDRRLDRVPFRRTTGGDPGATPVCILEGDRRPRVHNPLHRRSPLAIRAPERTAAGPLPVRPRFEDRGVRGLVLRASCRRGFSQRSSNGRKGVGAADGTVHTDGGGTTEGPAELVLNQSAM